MNTAVALLILAGIIAAVVLFRWLANRATDAVVNNTVGRSAMRTGEDMTTTDLVVSASASPQDVLAAIRSVDPAASTALEAKAG